MYPDKIVLSGESLSAARAAFESARSADVVLEQAAHFHKRAHAGIRAYLELVHGLASEAVDFNFVTNTLTVWRDEAPRARIDDVDML